MALSSQTVPPFKKNIHQGHWNSFFVFEMLEEWAEVKCVQSKGFEQWIVRECFKSAKTETKILQKYLRLEGSVWMSFNLPMIIMDQTLLFTFYLKNQYQWLYNLLLIYLFQSLWSTVFTCV